MALTVIIGDSLLKRSIEKKNGESKSILWKLKSGAEAKDGKKMMLEVVHENPSSKFQVIACLSYNNHRNYSEASSYLKKIQVLKHCL